MRRRNRRAPIGVTVLFSVANNVPSRSRSAGAAMASMSSRLRRVDSVRAM